MNNDNTSTCARYLVSCKLRCININDMHKILISIGENYFTFPPFLIFLFDTIAA